MIFTKKKGLIYSAIALVIVFVVSFYCTSTSFQNDSSLARTVVLEQAEIDYQELSAEFDEYNVQTNEKDVDIVAKKNFDMSILEELNLVGLDENEETFVVRYEISYIDNDSTIFLTVLMEGVDEISVIDTVPGLVSNNSLGEPDVMFVVDGEYIWLSDMVDSGVLNETGWFTNLFKIVQKAVLNVAQNVVKAVAPILKPAVRLANNVAIKLLGSKGAAALGGKILAMTEDENGIYHAKVDCWQQYFGYTDLYDTVFDAGTSMRSAKFPFDVNGDSYDDYILWAWKGDYLNLGAGAELGIYKRWTYSDDIWIVDKKHAMKMTLKLAFKESNIIDWAPSKNQWWITGFNSNYQKKNRDDLTATYTVTFNGSFMFSKFKEDDDVVKDYRWSFPSIYDSNYNYNYKATFVF